MVPACYDAEFALDLEDVARSKMSPHLCVLEPGLSSTIQDFGRIGYQDLGVPVSGALDSISLRLANALVGNNENSGALEVRFIGPTFRVEAESVRIALVGTRVSIELLGSQMIQVGAGRSQRLARGEVFRIGAVSDTSCCYLAVEGGFAVPAPFGSQSTYARGKLGGFKGRALMKGDQLPLATDKAPNRPELYLPEGLEIDVPGPVRVVLGPQDGYFTRHGVSTFLECEFEISARSDRMGLRLEGPTLEHSLGYNIISDGIATGAIQVPGTGAPIILLADHQTTGGYPKIATVVSADLPRLGRMKPGQKVRFEAVAVADAEQARRAQEKKIQGLINAIQPEKISKEINTEFLLANNLISGVVGIDE